MALATLLLTVTACGDSGSGAPTMSPPAGSPLQAACGDRVVVQTDWFPEPEHGAVYQLVGPGGHIDKEQGRYSGPIGATGVTLEIRAGGPFVGRQQVISRMYQDQAITFGFVNTDTAIRSSADLPTVAVVTPLEKNPQVLMWPDALYDFRSFADIGRAGVRVLYFEGVAYMDYLLAKGDLKREQVDGSYDGSPARFVAEGNLVQQGFATNEPYKYEHDIKEWGGRRIEFLLVHDSGFEIYAQALAVRPALVSEKRECLRLLVPLFQRAQVDYMRDPKPVNDQLLRIVEAYATFWTLSAGGNADAVRKMGELGIVGNGGDSTLGNFDLARVRSVIDTLTPLFAQTGKKVKENLRPEDLVTNEFIDPTIGL